MNHPRCGTLPDFGNFHEYDRYKGTDELMPFAKGVSAKSHDFDDKGDEIHTNYRKMMEIVVKKHNYHGFVGVEYEGSKISELEGTKATKALLEKIKKSRTFNQGYATVEYLAAALLDMAWHTQTPGADQVDANVFEPAALKQNAQFAEQNPPWALTTPH